MGGPLPLVTQVLKVAGELPNLAEQKVSDYMTPNPTTMKESDAIGYALHLMALHGYRHIPVVNDEEKPVNVAAFRENMRFIVDLYSNTNGDS